MQFLPVSPKHYKVLLLIDIWFKSELYSLGSTESSRVILVGRI
jgi:hypothetical protein